MQSDFKGVAVQRIDGPDFGGLLKARAMVARGREEGCVLDRFTARAARI